MHFYTKNTSIQCTAIFPWNRSIIPNKKNKNGIGYSCSYFCTGHIKDEDPYSF